MRPLSFFRPLLLGITSFGVTLLPVLAQSSIPYESAGEGAESAYTQGTQERSSGRVSYAHVTAVEGPGSVLSDANGRTDIQISLPLAERDQIVTQAGGQAEIELADGNRVQVAGESRLQLDALAGEQGSEATESAITLVEGSIAVESGVFTDNRAFRVDTADTSVYIPSGAEARVNLDPRRGTSVIVRRGSVDVRTRSGSIPARAGQYVLIHGEEQPEVARGSFSRDRFDVWVADRTQTILQAHNSVSERYVGDEGRDYGEDVAALDGYGTWDHSATYGDVWRPDVGADWSPYSDGYWCDTPVGATWVSNEPWGWFPHHYGNWFFDAGFGSWCWSPAFVYSPAWVYWGFSPGFVGWCPFGYYGFGGWGSGRFFSFNGIFDVGRIDCGRGWNFVGSNVFGSRFGRGAVLPGTQVASRLGGRIAVTSSPLRVPIVSGRGSGATALRSFARTASQTIARRTTPTQSAALTPFLARQRSLPPETVRALRQSQVARVNPVSRAPGAQRLPALSPRASTDRTAPAPRSLSGGAFGNPSIGRSESWRSLDRNVTPRSETPRSDWRTRPVSPPRGSIERNPNSGRERSVAPRSLSEGSPRSERFGSSSEAWRIRANAPPAQRVIEGIDRGRALPPIRHDELSRSLPERGRFESRPQPRSWPPSARFDRQAPPPAFERRAEPMPRYGRSAPSPAPRFEPRSSSPPREMHAAPPAREFRAPAPSRGAPSPRGGSHHSSDRPHR
jgi:hypothetical protein